MLQGVQGMIWILGMLLISTTVVLVAGIVTRIQLRDARRELRRLSVELDLAQIEKERSERGATAPVAEGDDAAYTDGERRVMDHLVVAWNLYVGLPRDHPDDVPDFKDAIHTCQRIVLANVALRSGRRHVD